MADVSIRGVTYTGIAKLDLDKSGGGSALYYDTEGADAVASDILTGKKAYGSSGLITGTRQPPSGSINITDNGAVDVTDYATALVNVSGGGGTDVDLHVVGGTTQPTNPEQNTIWVNTSTAVTSYALQHDEPDTPVAGMVWIQTSYFSFVPMNILPDNGVEVYPVAAYQYESGAWVEKEAKSYIDGTWKDWVVYVWNGEADISHWVRATAAATGSWDYTADGFLHVTTNSSGGAMIAYDVPFDLTNVSAVRYYGYSTGSGANRSVSVGAAIRGANAAVLATPSSWPRTDPLSYVDLDVSNLSGEYYVRIGAYNNLINRQMYFKRIVLIPIGGNI